MSSAPRPEGLAQQLVPADIPCLQLRFQMAWKLHAVSAPREPNDRFRDLIDLQLLDTLHELACVSPVAVARDIGRMVHTGDRLATSK